MKIMTLDHLVLTVRNIVATEQFYNEVLGMEIVEFNEGRRALKFGNQKINLHVAGHEITPHARHATVGSADLCFLVETSLTTVRQELIQKGISIELDRVHRTGAIGPIESIYIRDPDGNLIELANQL